MNFIINKDEFLKAKAAWTQPGYHHDATDHIIYNAIRGFDLQRGFSPITDSRKLQGSADEWQSFKNAKTRAAWALRTSASYTGEKPERAERRIKEDAERFKNLSTKFGIEFTPELTATIREMLK